MTNRTKLSGADRATRVEITSSVSHTQLRTTWLEGQVEQDPSGNGVREGLSLWRWGDREVSVCGEPPAPRTDGKRERELSQQEEGRGEGLQCSLRHYSAASHTGDRERERPSQHGDNWGVRERKRDRKSVV